MIISMFLGMGIGSVFGLLITNPALGITLGGAIAVLIVIIKGTL